MLLIYIVISGKSLVDGRGKNKYTYRREDSLSFEIWIFRNGQRDRDDHGRNCLPMNSTKGQTLKTLCSYKQTFNLGLRNLIMRSSFIRMAMSGRWVQFARQHFLNLLPPFDSWLSHHQSIGTDQRDLLTST